MSGSAAGPEDLGVVDSLVQLSFLIQSVLARIASAHDLSMVQTRLLGVLRDRELGMLELARVLELEKSSVTGLVDRAEKRGLVVRSAAHADGRAVRVTVTRAGRRLVAAVAEEVRVEIDTLVAGLSEPQRRRLSALSSQIVIRHAAGQGLVS